MDSNAYVKSFSCRKHVGNDIQRVCLEDDCEENLCCIDCALDSHNSEHKKHLVKVKEFLDDAALMYQRMAKITIDSQVTEQYAQFLLKEDEYLAKLSNHNEQTKSSIQTFYDNLIESFIKLCNNSKQKLMKKVDEELITLKANFKSSNTKINKAYGHSENQSYITSEALISRVNRLNGTDEFDAFVKEIKGDILQNKAFAGNMNDEGKWKERLSKQVETMMKYMNYAVTLFPTLENFSDTYTLKKTICSADKEFADGIVLQSSILPLSVNGWYGEMDSKIITKDSDICMIQKWLNITAPHTISFKLIYCGSRDGFTATAFHEKCDKTAGTITIIKAPQQNIFGGYISGTWGQDADVAHNKQGPCFIFSVNHKEKYVKKSNVADSWCCSAQHLCAFGSGGSDIVIMDACKSAVNYGTQDSSSFEMKGRKLTEIFGRHKFKVEEIEVFQVTGGEVIV
jgi:hypothetical protein